MQTQTQVQESTLEADEYGEDACLFALLTLEACGKFGQQRLGQTAGSSLQYRQPNRMQLSLVQFTQSQQPSNSYIYSSTSLAVN